jgi:hypothetical protein
MIKNLMDMFKKTWEYLITALVITIFLRYKFGAEFFDIFGLFIFSGLIFLGVYGLYSKKKIPNWVYFVLIVLGIFGILIDGWTSFNLIKSFMFGG